MSGTSSSTATATATAAPAAAIPTMASKTRPFATSINDYELGEMLGRGGFGFVFKARGRLGTSAQAHRDVAIKMIDKRLMRAANMSRKVANEVEVHWSLQHPSILRLLTYFEDDENVYLVMELCENGELYRYVQGRNQPLTEAEARRVMEQVVEGLWYLHSNGIIHRDLKLSNILLTDMFDIKIADFGLAVKLNDPNGEQKTMCGTPNYISPEIVSRQPYGLSADFWSLGCMLYTVLTGKPPFDSKVVKNTLDKVTRAEYTLPDHLSASARDLIQKLLMKEPQKRLPLAQVMRHPWFSPSLPRQRLSVLNNSPPTSTPSPTATSSTSTPTMTQDKRTMSALEATGANGEEDRPSSFSTTRLKPIRQVTKHGPIAILGDGSVELEFCLGGGRDGPVERMRISGDGGVVSIFEHGRADGPQEDETPLRLLARYERAVVPRQYWKRYKYAKRFVDLVRSKTPKIIFYSPQAKCILMENGPLADFEMSFYNGTRIRHSNSKRLLEITVPKPHHPSDSSPPTAHPPPQPPSPSDKITHRFDISRPERIAIPPHLLNVFRHVQECLRQCLDVESSLPSSQVYPVILKSSNAAGDDGAVGVEGVSQGWLGHSEVSSTVKRDEDETGRRCVSSHRPHTSPPSSSSRGQSAMPRHSTLGTTNNQTFATTTVVASTFLTGG
ncbi:hypothetical protein HDU67_009773, partial [Dinochytrium kinnereticum]